MLVGSDSMLILAKSILGLMLGFFVSVIFGYFLIPVLRKLKCGQTISAFTAFRHASKQGTPTIGGLIFIVPTLITMLFLYLRGSLQITSSLLIILFVLIQRHDSQRLTIIDGLLNVLTATGYLTTADVFASHLFNS